MTIHTALYPMDVQRMSFWDLAITIRYPEWFQLSNGYLGNVQVSTCVILQTKWKYFKIPYGSEKYVIVLLLHSADELF